MTVADIRRRKQAERLKGLHQQASLVLAEHPGGSLWLFGSWARGDWDGFSDVDVLALSDSEAPADRFDAEDSAQARTAASQVMAFTQAAITL